MRIICMCCNSYFTDKGNTSNTVTLYWVCLQCDRRVKRPIKNIEIKKKEIRDIRDGKNLLYHILYMIII